MLHIGQFLPRAAECVVSAALAHYQACWHLYVREKLCGGHNSRAGVCCFLFLFATGVFSNQRNPGEPETTLSRRLRVCQESEKLKKRIDRIEFVSFWRVSLFLFFVYSAGLIYLNQYIKYRYLVGYLIWGYVIIYVFGVLIGVVIMVIRIFIGDALFGQIALKLVPVIVVIIVKKS
jgi:hypothetical protein